MGIKTVIVKLLELLFVTIVVGVYVGFLFFVVGVEFWRVLTYLSIAGSYVCVRVREFKREKKYELFFSLQVSLELLE